ncbi:lipid A export permease/ATP-binding protein MsbA [Uliginosibacterium sp. H3]|uniref:Lipid A export permease/ATP-binding protein MsbA n=1 Tax=Uliginosibacterium silvisoli TaxID=3114758 RepID=A0ABU6KA44_9RHOO|nr:lipid A export permease/ATP-binding protein MsbA [Uliginosibacterium sp. H3]
MKESFLLYKRLLGYIRPYWRVVLLSFLAMAVGALCAPAMPALLQPLIDNFNARSDAVSAAPTTAVAAHGMLAQMSTWVDQLKAALRQDIRLIPLLILVVAIVKGITDYVASVASQWVSNKAIQDIREDVFRHQILLPVAEHQKQTSGRMLSRISYDIGQAGSALSTAWIVVIQDSLTILFLTVTLLVTAWELTLVILAIAPVIAWIIRMASSKMRSSSRDMQSTMALLTNIVEESIAGLKEIKIFGTQAHENERFKRVGNQLRRESMRVVRVSSLNVPLVQILASAAIAIVIFVATSLSASRDFSSGQFVAYITTMALLFEPIRRLTNVNSTIQRGLAGAQSIFELLDTPPETDQGKLPAPKSGGAIRFEHLGFRYPGQERAALVDFNLDVAGGETVAFVGASGSGKTTLMSLIARFFDADQGRILIDGVPIDAMPLTELRAQLALVGQHAALFDDTISNNIAYGRQGATQEEIVQAASQAHALEFIQNKPEGFALRIGTNGNQLSGGQRQRLAIARAFLKDAPILLLDEATSALDNESERVVREALVELRRNRTVLVIAHRLTTIRDANRIVVMDQGRIVEVGSHTELLAANGAYAQLLASGEEIIHD